MDTDSRWLYEHPIRVSDIEPPGLDPTHSLQPPEGDMSELSDPRVTAAIMLIGRTGAKSFDIRYQDDRLPVVWIAVAGYSGDRHEATAALDPGTAVFRLCDQLIDGGVCTHCRRSSGFEPSIDPMPLNDFVCWYQWDPELATYRRGCEEIR